MKTENTNISNTQLFSLVFCFAISSNLLRSTGGEAGKDAWLAMIAGALEGLVFILIHLALIKHFQGKTLVQWNDIIYGRIIGKLISMLYLLFFIHVAALVLRNFSDYFTGVIYHETPMIAVSSLLMIVCFFAVCCGIEVIARCSLIFSVILFVINIIVNLLLIKNTNINYLLPIMDIPIWKFIKASHTVATWPFGEFIVFTMIAVLSNNIKKIKSTVIKSYSVVTFIITMIAFSYVSVLGPMALIYTYPVFYGIRVIDVGEVITRIEIIINLSYLNMAFIKLSVYFYAIVTGISQMCKLRSYKPLSAITGLLIIAASMYIFDSYIGFYNYISKIWPYYAVFFQVFIPLVSLIIARIRKLPKEEYVS